MAAGNRFPNAEKGSPKKWGTPLLLAVAGLLLAAAMLLLPLFPALVIEDWRTGALLAACPVQTGERFQIRFTHSLNLSDVTDTIEWTGASLVCRETLFSTYGAGIPDLADGIGTAFTATDDGFLLSGIDKAEDRISIMLQTVPNHRLVKRGKTVSLLAQFGSGTVVTLSVRNVSLATLTLHRIPWR